MLFSHFRSGRVVPTPAPAITTLPTNVTYADVRGHRRMINGYTGNLFRLGCATASPTTLDIGQLPNGMPDMSGVTAWRNGSTAVFFEGEYNQVTGNYIAADSSAKRPLFIVDADENGFPALSMGYASNGT